MSALFELHLVFGLRELPLVSALSMNSLLCRLSLNYILCLVSSCPVNWRSTPSVKAQRLSPSTPAANRRLIVALRIKTALLRAIHILRKYSLHCLICVFTFHAHQLRFTVNMILMYTVHFLLVPIHNAKISVRPSGRCCYPFKRLAYITCNTVMPVVQNVRGTRCRTNLRTDLHC